MTRTFALLLAFVLITPAFAVDFPPATAGTIHAGVPHPDWQRGIAIFNPGDSAVMVTFGEQWIEVAAHATKNLPDASATFTATAPVVVYAYDINLRSGAQLFTPATTATATSRRRAVRAPSNPPVVVVLPQTITLTPSKDDTLYESSNGLISNGAGPSLFVGLTSSGVRRRAVIAFDVASQIPPGAKINSATLTMTVSNAIFGPNEVALRRVTADWGQGASDAGSSRAGTGTTSRTNDATWLHRFFSATRWATLGGDFATASDATANVPTFGTVVWGPDPLMTARVQGWVDQPATNFGWLLLGDEHTNRSAKGLYSREAPSNVQPKLTIEFLARP